MAFLVQSDDGNVAGATSYVALDYVRAYHLDRGTDLQATSDADLQAACVKATQYLDIRYHFPGEKRNNDQETEWPRNSVLDTSQYLITGVPKAVKDAVSELANIALTADLLGNPTRDATGRDVQSSSVGAGPAKVTTTFAPGAAFKLPTYPVADRLLIAAGILRSGMSWMRG